jgi:hypothetical protein
VDRLGIMYRDRINDLLIQAAAVYAFAHPHQIHRFLDFTYEHFTLYPSGKSLSSVYVLHFFRTQAHG